MVKTMRNKQGIQDSKEDHSDNKKGSLVVVVKNITTQENQQNIEFYRNKMEVRIYYQSDLYHKPQL